MHGHLASMLNALLLVLVLASPGVAQGQQPDLAGLWKTIGDRSGQADSLVRIVENNGEYVGVVVTVFSPPAADANPVCALCRGELKDKPVVGMTILRGLRRQGDSYAGGAILDPDDGDTYRCTVRLLESGRKLEMRGYIGLPIFGRTQVWIRAN